MDQQDEIMNDYNNEMKKMEQIVAKELHDICIRHEHGKMHLEARRKELEMLEKELELREELNESAKRSLVHQKDMNEMAILEQKKAHQDLSKLAEEQMREKESLHERIFKLEANLDQKQALELEMERLKGAVEIMGHMNLIKVLLKEKEEELGSIESLTRTLNIKEWKTNVEVLEARKELIKSRKWEDLMTMHSMLQQRSDKEAPKKTAELYSFWDAQLRDPNWNPFKTILDGENAKEIIDEDEKLSGLRQELGEEVCQAVITALKEISEYNRSGRYHVAELWNSRENRRASLREGAEYIIKAWRQKKANEVLQ